MEITRNILSIHNESLGSEERKREDPPIRPLLREKFRLRFGEANGSIDTYSLSSKSALEGDRPEDLPLNSPINLLRKDSLPLNQEVQVANAKYREDIYPYLRLDKETLAYFLTKDKEEEKERHEQEKAKLELKIELLKKDMSIERLKHEMEITELRKSKVGPRRLASINSRKFTSAKFRKKQGSRLGGHHS
jgi:DNA-binding protein H-NS